MVKAVTKKVLTPEEKLAKQNEAEKMISGLVKKSQTALEEFSNFTQEDVDRIGHAMALAGLENHLVLAKEAHEETGRGVTEDKAIKNIFATENIWNSIKDDKTVGIINRDDTKGQVEIAAPLGIIAAVVPTTNPTSTTMFKAILAAKTRNTIIFGFHPQAQNSSAHAAKILYDAAIEAGAPKNFIQWIEKPSIYATTALMQNPSVATILATGGPGMVNAALKSGNPSMGVGAGNGVVYFEKTTDIKRAVNDVMLSKTFDNGMICATENNSVIDKEIYSEVLQEMKRLGGYLVPKSDHKKLSKAMFNDALDVNGPIAGASALKIAELAGIKVPADTKVLLVEVDKIGMDEPQSAEKLSPVLSLYKVKGHEDAIDHVQRILAFKGSGHNSGIQIGNINDPFVDEYGKAINASRVIVNQPSALGGIGDVYNSAMRPSLTLGTGSWGKNSLSHNLSTSDLLNIKTIAKRRNNMQWIKLPSKIYFEHNSLNYLQDIQNIGRVFIVSDPGMMEFGYVKRVTDELALRSDNPVVSVYSAVKPDPTINQTREIAKQMEEFKPDTIILLGGGSALDAGKIARMIYENPNVDFKEMQQKFIDIRKRVVPFDKPQKTSMIAIPTTSGTGSEVTPFAVITDDKTHVKYPLADYTLTPDVAIVDPELVMTVPKRTVAHSGIDALSHALESYVSVMSSDFTKPWALQAIKLVFANLKDAYNGDAKAREEMHYAATLAGMSFANAFLGINHSLAHKIGGEYELPHGLAIAIAMPKVIAFNASDKPKKITPYPKYESYTAQADYAEIARQIGLKGKTDKELVEKLIKEIKKLTDAIDIDITLSGNGVDKKDFADTVDHLAELSYEDQCTPGNPREPLISELKELMENMF